MAGIEAEIRKAVQSALDEVGTRERIDSRTVQFAVEWPADISHGDYATNVALAAAKAFNMKPQYLAGELLPRIREKLGYMAERIDIAGPGFINITLSREFLAEQVRIANSLGIEFGNAETPEEKRVMIEYSNPNPFKEIHIGHLMSNVVGESLSRLLESTGATVLRDTFGGDVGPHVAKAIWALQQKGVTDIGSVKEIGAAYTHGSNAYEESEKAKKEIDDLNTRIYAVVAKQNSPEELSDEDRQLLELWRKGREVSMLEFERIFGLLGTKFDYVFYDSDTTDVGMQKVQEGLEKGIFEESEGAIIYRGEKKGLHTLVFITSRGTPTYETKDIGLAFLKEERDSTDEVLIVTAVEQIGHFEVVLAALAEIAPLLAEKTHHIPHGLLRLPTGKMSSRKGNVITGADLLEEVIAKASEKNDDPLIAQQVAVGAVKFMILRQAPGGDIIFDAEKSLSLEGDSGPYLQYATVRAQSILAQEKTNTEDTLPDSAYTIERLLARFPEAVARAANDRAPSHLVTYLTQLAGEWNSFYAKERIIGGEFESYKLELAQAFVHAMRNGLTLLGIPVPEKM